MSNKSDQSGGLRQGALGVPGIVAVSAGGVAPEYSILLTGSVVAGVAGGGTPGAFVVACVGMLAFGAVMASLSRFVSAAGGLYSFARRALGGDAGYMTGWLYLGIALVVTPATFISSAFLIQNFFAAALPGVGWLSSSWVLWAVIITPLVLAATYIGVTVSVQLLLALTAVGIAAIVILDLAILFHGGLHGIPWNSLRPWPTNGISTTTFLLGVGIAVTCLAGSEGAVFMAEEARDPRRTVPRAILFTIGIVVAFYLLTSLALTAGLGTENTASWGNLGADVVRQLSSQYLTPWFGTFLLAIVAIAGLTGCLAFSNYVARLIFEWGRTGHLPRVFAKTHPRFLTPAPAIGALAVIALIGYVASWMWKGGSATGGLAAFSWMYEVDAVLIAFIYPVVAISAAVVGRKYQVGLISGIVAPVVVVILIGISIKAQFFPLPASPFNVAVYAALGWIVLGVVVRVLTRNRVHDGDFDEEQEAFVDGGGGGEVKLPA